MQQFTDFTMTDKFDEQPNLGNVKRYLLRAIIQLLIFIFGLK